MYFHTKGGAVMLDNLSVPGRPTNLDNNRARAYCAYSRCELKLFGNFLSPIIILFSARYKLKYCLKEPLNHNQPANQLIFIQIVEYGSKFVFQH